MSAIEKRVLFLVMEPTSHKHHVHVDLPTNVEILHLEFNHVGSMKIYEVESIVSKLIR